MHSLHALLTQFRSRYPIGSLISEFVTVHEGQFIVRASVRMGGATVATGLAIAADLEQAEERAKVRALESLGLVATAAFELELPAATSAPSALKPDLEAGLSYSTRSSSAPEPTTLPPYPPLSTLDPPDAVPSGLMISTSLASQEETGSARIVADLYAHIAEGEDGDPGVDLFEEPVDLSKLVTPASQLLGKTPRRKTPVETSSAPETAPESAPEPVPSSAPEPASGSVSIDFSNVLMETDVELRRLGWDSKKGREHLKRTYGKRSRQELSETELYDFLEYLKMQPSLGQTPF